MIGSRSLHSSQGKLLLWGPQTQKCLQNFKIGTERMPLEIVHAIALVKKCSATVNRDLGLLDPMVAQRIIAVAERILQHELDDQFPLLVWQTGSGTQTNMNVNEVIANIASNGSSDLDPRISIHPNDHVNMGQSSNDTFSTAMHISVSLMASQILIPSLRTLANTLALKGEEFREIIKIGRTHLQDAVPLTLGQEFHTFAGYVHNSVERIEKATQELQLNIPQGGTAIGSVSSECDVIGIEI
jgi:fumarate hydratase class II